MTRVRALFSIEVELPANKLDLFAAMMTNEFRDLRDRHHDVQPFNAQFGNMQVDVNVLEGLDVTQAQPCKIGLEVIGE